ncbi:MAG TPA: LysR family transcriptional regulator [Rhodanobacteraceae bacterium]|nr:LysR family transcriptional regulator [Rhodanobacteraceae bacterium]
MVQNRSAPSSFDETPVGLPALLVFECVARHRSFARAAEELDVSPTAVSKAIRRLEGQLGVRVLNRTTRSVALSEIGGQLLARLAPALEEIRGTVRLVRGSAGKHWGTLRLNTSYVAYTILIERILPAFLRQHPDIDVEVSIDNALSDIVGASFDAGIRFGHALQKDMVALPLGAPQRRVVVGSRAYFAAHPRPERPQDLIGHDCIRQRLSRGSRSFEWAFQVGRKRTVIAVSGRLLFDEMRSVLEAARAGCGLAYVFEQFADVSPARGKLISVLGAYSPPPEHFHLYYPARALMPGKLRAFVDFLRSGAGLAQA